MATGPIETHLHRSFNWENAAPGPREGPRGRSANCGNGLFAQCVRLRSEINPVEYVEDTSILKDYEARLELRGSVDGFDSKVIWQKDHITMNTAPTDIPSNEIDLSDFDWLEFRVYSTKGYTGNGIPVLLSSVKLIKE